MANYSGPLSSLYGSDQEIQSLHFPSDLGDDRRSHWINFYISSPEKATAQKTTVTLAPSSGLTVDNSANAVFTNGATVANVTDSFYQYTVTPGKTKLESVISLYMPDTFNTSQVLKYEALSLTELFGNAGLLGGAANSLWDNFSNGSNSGFKEAIKTVSMSSAELALKQIGGESLVNVGLKAAGKSLNPQMELLFKAINFREFQFNFTFTPKNADEAATVENIIKTFKYHSAPSIDDSSGRYFVVPSVFEIEVFFNGQPNKAVNKITVAALESVLVDYAPSGWYTHEDGRPVQTNLTLRFKEMDIMTKEKINQGY